MATNKGALAGPSRPLGSPEIPQYFLPPAGDAGVYVPHLYGSAHIHFVDKKRKFDESRTVAVVVSLEPATRIVDWDAAVPVSAALLTEQPRPANYLPLPAGAMDLKVFARWAKSFDRWLARTQRLDVTPQAETPEVTSIGPKRGGVSVDLVAVVWVLT